jgi:hypothetical protein
MFTWKLDWKKADQCCYCGELDQIFYLSYSKHQQSSNFNWGRKTVLKGKYFQKITAFLMANLEAE